MLYLLSGYNIIFSSQNELRVFVTRSEPEHIRGDLLRRSLPLLVTRSVENESYS